MSREAKVGIFVVLGLVILTYFTFRVSKWGGVAAQGYNLSVEFESAAGLEPKANVKMAGVPVGKVEEIRLEGDKARLDLRIDKGIRIPVDSMASIQTQGLLGEKYVEIIPGKQKDQTLPPGGRIAQTIPPPDLDHMIRKLSSIADDVKRFTESLSGTVGTEEGKEAISEIIKNIRETTAVLRSVTTANEERLQRIIANMDRLSGDLSEISSANKENLRVTIANFRDFSQTLKEQTPGLARKLETMSEQVSGVVGENRENIKESIANLRVASGKLDNTLESAQRVMAKIERGEGTLGKLVNDNTTVGSLNDTLEGINRYVRKTESLKTFLDYRLEYRTEPSDYKHYVNLKLQPSADKYYLIGVVDDPRGKLTSSEVTTTTGGVTTTAQQDTFQNRLKVSAQIAKRFSGLTLRGGVIENSGGVGAEYDVIPERLTVGVDAFDFTRKGDQPPHLKAFGNYDIVKNLFITGGVDDVLNNDRKLRTFFFGLGIKFADEDLKTVLGAVPLKP